MRLVIAIVTALACSSCDDEAARAAPDLATPRCPADPLHLPMPCMLGPTQSCDYHVDNMPPFYCECAGGTPRGWFCEPIDKTPRDLGF